MSYRRVDREKTMLKNNTAVASVGSNKKTTIIIMSKHCT